MNKKTDKPDENLTAQRIRENKDKVLELVPVMLTIKAICDAVGISRETYYDWLGKDSLFAE
ncbi:MAG: helix-turn-helix domain-containing protein, partial [Candidatus Peribacteraceae bacterium]|nr:helix-turn-helix domain-containing protein [Candidatus Peribacteraceae bacterium]